LGDAAGERRPPNTVRTKHVPQTLIRRGLGDALGDAAEDVLIQDNHWLNQGRGAPHDNDAGALWVAVGDRNEMLQIHMGWLQVMAT
jgi:hypothetical protein